MIEVSLIRGGEYTPEQIKLARAIVKGFYPEMRSDYSGRRLKIALAAIEAVTERAASWLEQYPSPMNDLDLAMRIRGICEALRRGNHLK